MLEHLLSILTLFTEFHKIQALNSSDQTVKYSIAGFTSLFV